MDTVSAVMIILNYNDGQTAAKLALTVKDYACLDKIIVVDNCSADDSFVYLRNTLLPSPDEKAAAGVQMESRLDVIQAPENGGYAKGNNYGIRYALSNGTPDYLFIANPDIMVSEQTLDAILERMRRHPEYGAMSCLVNQGYNVWRLPGFSGMIESLFLIWFNLDKRAIKKRLAASALGLETVGVVEGSFFCIKKTAYEAIGGFDERTFLYAEEIILSKRLAEHGLKVGILTRERYDHFHSVSIKKAYRSSKARAFPNFYRSFHIYNRYYLHTNPLQDAVFAAAYGLAYAERVIYDLLMRLRS
ncbi:MAG: glycosyltransferase family 2 protein [Lachnospiraceae bacterium]